MRILREEEDGLRGLRGRSIVGRRGGVVVVVMR
jgi:hypothetical protein